MADAYKGLTVKLGADTSSLSSALRKAKSEMSGVSSELRQIERALKLDPGNVKLLAQQQRDYQKAIKSTEEQLKVLRQAEKDALDGTQPMNDEQWTKLQSDIAICEQKLKGYKQALTESMVQQGAMNSILGKTGAGIESFGTKVEGFGRGVESAGRTLTRTLTPAVLGAGAATVAAAVDIDSSLTSVKKTVDGTEEQYRQLKDATIEFSETNAVSASQILDIQALGAQLGFAIDELDEFSEVVSGLDIATNMDADTAATEMAQFANITKMSHDEVSNYGSAVVGLGNNFATTESDISAMAMRLAAAGTQVGMSQADILGLATALSSMGVEAEAGGTAISTIMSQIDKDIATNSESVETWASTAGMSAQAFADAWRADPVNALSALLSNMELTTAEGGNMSVMLEELGIDAVRQTDIMKRLAGNSSLVADAVSTANDEWSANTALSKEVENRNESLAAKFEILKNRAVAIADEFGGPLADALLDIVDQAEPLIQMISDGAKQFNEMSDSEQQAVLKAVALSAALGPMLTVVGSGAQKIKTFGTGLQTLARFFARVDVAMSGTAKATSAYQASMKSAERATTASSQAEKTLAQMKQLGMSGTKASTAATKSYTTATKAASVASGAFKAALGGVVAAFAGLVITKVVSDIMDYNSKVETAKGATEGLRDAVATSGEDFSGSIPGIESAAGAVGLYSDSAIDAMQSQADLAKEIKETWSDIGANKAILQDAMGVIEKYAGQTNLTADQQNALRAAVDQVNEVCGTNYSVIDAANGVLSASTGEIKANTDAWIANAEAQAATEQLVELKKKQYELNGWLAESEQKILDMEREWPNVRQAASAGDKEAIHRESELTKELQNERQNRDWLTDALADNQAAQERLNGVYNESQAALQGSAEKIAEYINSNAGFSESLAGAGIDVSAFSQKLSELGFTTQDLASLSSEQLVLLAQSYDLSVADIVAKCDEMGIAVPEKMRQAVTGATAEVQAEAPNAANAMLMYKDGMLQSYDPVTGQFSQVTNDALAQITGGLAAGSPNVEAAVAGMREGMFYMYDPIAGMFVQVTDNAMAGAASSIANGTPAVQGSAAGLVGGIDSETSQMEGVVSSNVAAAGNAMVSGINAAQGPVSASADTVSKLAADHMSSASADAWWAGHNMAGDSFRSGIDSGRDAAVGSADTASKNVADHFSSANGDAWWAGYNMASGMAQGIDSGRSLAVSAAISVARDAINAAKAEADIHSPSRVMEEAGEFFTEGWAIGIGNKTRMAVESARKMVESTFTAVPSSMSSVGNMRLSASAEKPSSSSAVNVTVDNDGGITKADVYDAMVAAIGSAGGGEVAVYVDGKKLASSIAKPMGVELARAENLGRW